MVSNGHRSLEDVDEMQCQVNLPVYEGTQAKVIRVLDGDTVLVATFREDCDSPVKTSVRLLGYDAAEIHSKDLDEKRMGFCAKKRMEDAVLDKIVKLNNVSTDKYGKRCRVIEF